MLHRRHFIAGTAALLSSTCLAHAQQSAPKISATDAHQKALAGELLLIDVRSPDEWKQSGIGASARPISMHQPGFIEKLAAAVGPDKNAPIALMCATGRRSGWLQGKLKEFGYTNLISVGEGMHGSADGIGWLKSGLPVKKYGN